MRQQVIPWVRVTSRGLCGQLPRAKLHGLNADAVILNGRNFGASCTSSRREDTRIAQGETLGMRLTERFPTRRGGANAQHGSWIQDFIARAFDPPLPGE